MFFLLQKQKWGLPFGKVSPSSPDDQSDFFDLDILAIVSNLDRDQNCLVIHLQAGNELVRLLCRIRHCLHHVHLFPGKTYSSLLQHCFSNPFFYAHLKHDDFPPLALANYDDDGGFCYVISSSYYSTFHLKKQKECLNLGFYLIIIDSKNLSWNSVNALIASSE